MFSKLDIQRDILKTRNAIKTNGMSRWMFNQLDIQLDIQNTKQLPDIWKMKNTWKI